MNQQCNDNKGTGLKCMLGGVAAGVAVSMVGVVLMNNNKRTLQKKAGKVADAMESLVDSAKNMFQ